MSLTALADAPMRMVSCVDITAHVVRGLKENTPRRPDLIGRVTLRERLRIPSPCDDHVTRLCQQQKGIFLAVRMSFTDRQRRDEQGNYVPYVRHGTTCERTVLPFLRFAEHCRRSTG